MCCKIQTFFEVGLLNRGKANTSSVPHSRIRLRRYHSTSSKYCTPLEPQNNSLRNRGETTLSLKQIMRVARLKELRHVCSNSLSEQIATSINHMRSTSSSTRIHSYLLAWCTRLDHLTILASFLGEMSFSKHWG
jgi:hypothetical protein